MKVIAIYEDNHGMIGIASTKRAAARFIVHNNWFGAYDEVWVCALQEGVPANFIMRKQPDEITADDLVDFLLEVFESNEYDIGFNFREEEIWEEE